MNRIKFLLIIGTCLGLAISAIASSCSITIIYNADGSPDYEAINEQFTESYEH